ncbi:hypothetical protein CEXT_550561 [Caerostris extrusa]|uniref:Uncharacterized protein n=1 Tax=Caerostris extrusa TaxID=172846 RepID=A0AAV4RCD5_CAEEX|nr:hypothetical protein CEXT_550561 [Caerostris extrusa]
MKYFDIDKRHARRLSDRPSDFPPLRRLLLSSGFRNPKFRMPATANRFRNGKLKFLSPQERFLFATVCSEITHCIKITKAIGNTFRTFIGVPGQFIPLVAKMRYFNIDKRHARRLSDRPSGSDTSSPSSSSIVLWLQESQVPIARPQQRDLEMGN